MTSSARFDATSGHAIDIRSLPTAAAILNLEQVRSAVETGASHPPGDIDGIWELASLIQIEAINERAALHLDIQARPAVGRFTDLVERRPEVAAALEPLLDMIATGDLDRSTTHTQKGSGRHVAVSFSAADTTYRRVTLTLRDVTAEATATKRAERLIDQMHSLHTAINAIARRIDVEDIQDELPRQAVAVLNAADAALFVIDVEARQVVEVLRDGIESAPKTLDGDWDQFNDGLGGRALATGETVIAAGLSPDDFATTEMRAWFDEHGYPSHAIATRIDTNQPYAYILVALRIEDVAFTEADTGALRLLAASAGRAMESSTLYSWISEESAALVAAQAEITQAYDQLAQAQAQLLQAQKLESIGQLASGIAHEINTPIQFIGDNTQFLADIFPYIREFHRTALTLADAVEDIPALADPLAELRTAAEDADLEFADEESIEALAQIQEGVDRVAAIVRAMKDFAHPGSEEKSPVDINEVIQTTIAVASNEWKYHSEVETDLDEGLPLVPALAGPLKQAILVLVVNAAQAIQDVVGSSGTKGTIAIATRQRGNCVEVRITDTGGGIPEEVQPRIFDPFFTTKDVGRGSGQGLTITWSAIVEQHGGTITFETEPGVGTTFIVSLPLALEEVSAHG